MSLHLYRVEDTGFGITWVVAPTARRARQVFRAFECFGEYPTAELSAKRCHPGHPISVNDGRDTETKPAAAWVAETAREDILCSTWWML